MNLLLAVATQEQNACDHSGTPHPLLLQLVHQHRACNHTQKSILTKVKTIVILTIPFKLL